MRRLRSGERHFGRGHYWLFVFLLPCNASFAQWEFDVVADVGVIYTDNLRLSPAGTEEDEIVYLISPTFALSNTSDRLNADIRYKPEAYFYSDAQESDNITHTVDATLTAELMRDALFVDFSAAMFQITGTAGESFAFSNLPIALNRTDSRVLEVRPYWKQNLGFADILAEVGHRDSRYDTDDLLQRQFLEDNTEINGRFSLNNHSHHDGVAWGLDYDYVRLEYDQAVPFEYQTASANLGYWVLNGITRLFVVGGVETPFDSYFDPSMEDDFWEAGFQYTPNQRFDIEIAFGRRSFGDSIRAGISYQFRRGRTELSYEEGVAGRGGIGAGRRPILATDNLDFLLDRPGQTDRFVQKRGQWLTTIELARSDISVRIFSDKREKRATDIGLGLEDESLDGAAFRWAWRLGTNSTLGFGADIARRESELGDNDLTRVSIDYTLQFSQRLSIVILAQRANESGQNSVTAGDYTENQYRLTLHARL